MFQKTAEGRTKGSWVPQAGCRSAGCRSAAGAAMPQVAAVPQVFFGCHSAAGSWVPQRVLGCRMQLS